MALSRASWPMRAASRTASVSITTALHFLQRVSGSSDRDEPGYILIMGLHWIFYDAVPSVGRGHAPPHFFGHQTLSLKSVSATSEQRVHLHLKLYVDSSRKRRAERAQRSCCRPCSQGSGSPCRKRRWNVSAVVYPTVGKASNKSSLPLIVECI